MYIIFRPRDQCAFPCGTTRSRGCIRYMFLPDYLPAIVYKC